MLLLALRSRSACSHRSAIRSGSRRSLVVPKTSILLCDGMPRQPSLCRQTPWIRRRSRWPVHASTRDVPLAATRRRPLLCALSTALSPRHETSDLSGRMVATLLDPILRALRPQEWNVGDPNLIATARWNHPAGSKEVPQLAQRQSRPERRQDTATPRSR